MLRFAAIVLVLQFALPLAAQEKAKPTEFRGQDAQRVAAWLKVSQDQAAEYRLFPTDQPDAPMKVLPNAVFRHSQPVRGDDIGAVYLWIDELGKPAALGTVFAYSQGGPGERWVAHEFHSLADKPLTGQWRDSVVWAPDKPGLAWNELSNLPVAETAPARLRQMREIGRKFAARSIDAKDSRWELRLITQPVYQYTAKEPADIIGGGVFLFCQGTDPEIILALEARRRPNSNAWYYAFAPFTDYGLSVTLDDKEVWSLDRGHRPNRNSTHWWNGHVETKALSADEEAALAKAFKAAPNTQ